MQCQSILLEMSTQPPVGVPQDVAAPMFPYEDECLDWDDYGEVFEARSFFVEEPANGVCICG